MSAKRRGILALAALVLSLSVGVLVFSARAWLGVRRMTPWSWVALRRAKVVEAKVTVTEIAWGVALCAERSKDLSPTSAKVPSSIGAVAGMVYQSQPSDWNDPAFRCAGFHMHSPQRFQYQWVRGVGAGAGDEEGVVQADADFDGDGVIDHTVRIAVRCEREEGALRCQPDPMPTEPFAPLLTPQWWE